MPDIITGPPEAGTYRYVMFRCDTPRNHTIPIANYGNHHKSRVVDWPEGWDLPNGRGNPNAPTEEDRRVTMVFLNDRHLRDRCRRLGWHDCTDRWFEHLGHPGNGPMPDVPLIETPSEFIDIED